MITNINSKTRWTGIIGDTIKMYSGTTTQSYVDIWLEPPNTFSGNSIVNGNSADVHSTIYPYKTGSLKIWINGIEVNESDVIEEAPTSGTFRIDNTDSGICYVSYLPRTSYYGDKRSLYSNSFPRLNIIPFTSRHINEIINRIRFISREIGAYPQILSTTKYTGVPVLIDSDNPVSEDTPYLKHLINEIISHIYYIMDYLIGTYNIGNNVDLVDNYKYNILTGDIISQIRQAINEIETNIIIYNEAQ